MRGIVEQERARPPVVAIVSGFDDYQRRLLAGAGSELAAAGVPLIVHADVPRSRGLDAPLLRGMLERLELSGVLSVDTTFLDESRSLHAALTELAVPVVHIGPPPPGRVGVMGDNDAGMRQLMRHLLTVRRPRHVVLVRGIAHHRDSIEREALFREEMAAHGVAVDERLVIDGDFSAEVTSIAMRRILAQGHLPDAVVALNDPSGLAVMHTLKDAGLRVPEDVAVTGFDDTPEASRWPGLTTVAQDLEEQGRRAVRALLDPNAPTESRIVVPSRLVVRGSTAPPGMPAVRDLDTAIAMARREESEAATHADYVSLSYALDACDSLDDLVEAIGAHLTRTGMERAFLALHDDRADGPGGSDPSLARLVLDHRDGRTRPVEDATYPSWQLLPDDLSQELRRGMLVVQPLAVLSRPLGFVLFAQKGSQPTLTELMRLDLSRAIDVLLSTREAATRTATLERAVEQRTRDLEAEVAVRRSAERRLQAAYEELRRSSSLDGLTGIANRAAFEEHLDHHWQALASSTGELSMLLVDVDWFKPYNDEYGHVLGDAALRVVAAELAGAIRGDSDLAARYGGEEFAVVLPATDVAGALLVAERFRARLRQAGIEHRASPTGRCLTASVGIATVTPSRDGSPERLIGMADRALYEAKHRGRDRVEVATSTTDATAGRRHACAAGSPAPPSE